jgi:multidrug efflux pump
MSHGHTDQEMVARTHNTARFFTETRHIAWVLLIATMVWGVYGYVRMPQRKDPDIPIRQALALVPWPGASAERIEQLVTRKVEEKIGENAKVEKIESNTRTGLTAIFITLVEGTKEVGKEFDDIKLKLDAIKALPDGAGPIAFVKDFGDTAALMLTVASPKTGPVEIALRAKALQKAIEETRNAPAKRCATSDCRKVAQGSVKGAHGFSRAIQPRITIAHGLPESLSPSAARAAVDLFLDTATAEGLFADPRVIQGPGFVAVDAASDATDAEIEAFTQRFLHERLRASELHPDAWTAIVVRDPAETAAKLERVAGDKYSYRELDDYTELVTRTLKTLPIVSKVTRTGLLDERVFLEYSQERLASYGVTPGRLSDVLASRNITTPGGVLEVGGKNLTIDPSGEFKSEQEIGDVLVPTNNGRAVYLRDLAAVGRSYVSPPTFLNFFGARAPDGRWRRSRGITIAVQMRAGAQIATFGKDVDESLGRLKKQLPEDLVMARTSDQPRQVTEQIDLFMNSLYEAVILVVFVSLIGFWEWRSALLMALSIPITLGMTFGMMYLLGIDLQQVSIASLIIALGLLVDDPVVAGDAIKRDLALGHPPIVAAWLGPTKLATAILFATITNIVAYVPFAFIPGDTGTFLYSLPVVIGCSLVASRIVSMTFIPLLGYYILRPKAEPTIEDRRKAGFAAAYYRFGRMAIRHRWAFLAALLVLLAGGTLVAKQLRTQFFPKDLQYLSWVDVWLPEDAPLSATQQATAEAEAIVREVAGDRLRSMTTFIGGGGPRFWLSASPEQSQLNYAQILMEVYDKHDTSHLVEPLQHALSSRIASARVDVRMLEVGSAVGIPVAVRISGEDIPTLRNLAAEVSNIFRAAPGAARVRDNWGPESFAVRLKTDPDRANLSGLTNIEIAGASATAMNGSRMTVLREGDKQIPVLARMRMEERGELSDIRNLYVYASNGRQKVPLEAVTTIDYGMQTEKLQRRNQFRTITISAFTTDDVLPSQVLNASLPKLQQLERALPPGYRMEIGGEYEEQTKGFKNLAVVMLISVTMIFLALVIQFRHAVKPLIVFAAIPFGVMGALMSLYIMGTPFGFMAFLGVASLIGVIVSHIIVLFDFIEEMHAEGKPLEEALLDAGIVRLRPVLITVAATVIALFPLAAHGGPLWEPMCYTQIGGLTVATFVTLLVVPVIYATFVLDLKLVRWNAA